MDMKDTAEGACIAGAMSNQDRGRVGDTLEIKHRYQKLWFGRCISPFKNGNCWYLWGCSRWDMFSTVRAACFTVELGLISRKSSLVKYYDLAR